MDIEIVGGSGGQQAQKNYEDLCQKYDDMKGTLLHGNKFVVGPYLDDLRKRFHQIYKQLRRSENRYKWIIKL